MSDFPAFAALMRILEGFTENAKEHYMQAVAAYANLEICATVEDVRIAQAAVDEATTKLARHRRRYEKYRAYSDDKREAFEPRQVSHSSPSGSDTDFEVKKASKKAVLFLTVNHLELSVSSHGSSLAQSSLWDSDQESSHDGAVHDELDRTFCGLSRYLTRPRSTSPVSPR